MTFIKYTTDGKVVIQDAALFLSGLNGEEMLEMHLRENAIVLLKPDMPYLEKLITLRDLTQLIGEMALGLTPEVKEPSDTVEGSGNPVPVEACQAAGGMDEDTHIYTPKEAGGEDSSAYGYNIFADTITFSPEVFEDAGIWGKNLLIQSVDGAVVILSDDQVERMSDKAMTAISKSCLDTAIVASLMGKLRKRGGANA